MGKRGPRPAPTTLKIIKGEKKSRITKNEPKAPVTPRAPGAPSWMSDDAKKVWRALAGQLHRRKLLTEWDRECFAVFCESVVHHRLACQLVDGSAVLVKGAQGNLVKNPALQVVRDSALMIRAMAQEFGLTPSARAGIEMPDEEVFDAARRLLS